MLQIVAFRKMSRISTGAAVTTWLIALLLPAILIGMGTLLLGISVLGLFGLGEIFG